MKNIILILIGVLFYTSVSGQTAKATKPTLMVMPSEAWCNNNGYMNEYDNQGTKELMPDYKNALQTNSELNLVISKIGELMAERGFPLVDLMASIRSLERDFARGIIDMVELTTDIIKLQARADITLVLDYKVTATGPKQTVAYNLQALDAYTNKQIAASSNVGNPSFSADVPILLQEAVLANIDNFNAQLQMHFDDLFANGREITIEVQIFDNQGINFEKEYSGKELKEIIDEWVYQNTVLHRYSVRRSLNNVITFDQVRIPLFDEKGKPMNANSFVQALQKYLKAAPYNITSKVDQLGLGQAVLIIGDK